MKFRASEPKIAKRNHVTCLISTKRKPLKHKVARKIHFFKRFYERVGYVIDDIEYERLQNKVKESGRFLYRRPNDIGAVYQIYFRGASLRVVYDVFSHSLITVLPR